MRSVSVLFAVLAVPSSAFAPVALTGRAVEVLKAAPDDLSVPSDSAARLAYDEWRKEFNKGAFDPVRFENFKANYEAITVANVKAKKQARDEGNPSPNLLSLNEFGDYSAAEYEAAQKTTSPTTTGDLLSKAVEAAESQSAASNALGDAAKALAEEEEVRMCSNDSLVAFYPSF